MLKNQPVEREHKLTLEDRRNGGLARTPRKKYKQRLNALKKKGLSKETYNRLIDIMEDSKCSILDIRLFLDHTKASDLTINQQIKLANTYIKLHQSHYGIKIEGKMKHKAETAIINIVYPNGYKKDGP